MMDHHSVVEMVKGYNIQHFEEHHCNETHERVFLFPFLKFLSSVDLDARTSTKVKN